MPQNSPTRSKTHVWAILGALIAFILSVAVPSITIGAMKLLPQDVEQTISSTPSPAILFDPQASCPAGSPRSCYIVETTAQLTRQQNITATDSKENVNLSVREEIVRTDNNQAIISTSDHLSLIRDSTYPVLDPSSKLSVKAPSFFMDLETGEFTRDGLQYYFPFETEKRSYDFFDFYAQRAIPLDFLEEKEGTYVFTHTVTPQNLIDSATRSYTHPDDISDEPTGAPLQSELSEGQRETLRKMLVTAPASEFYPQGVSVSGTSVSGTVVLKPYYTATRTITVEPNSGIILDRSDDVFFFLAQNEEEAEATAQTFADNHDVIKDDNDMRARTLFQTTMSWDERTQNQAKEAAAPTNSTLAMLRIFTFICQVIGLGLLVFGLWRYNSVRKA